MSDSLRKALAHGPDCPPVPDLLASSDQFRAHLVSCPACQTELALFQRFESEAETAAERLAVSSIVGELKKNPAGHSAEPRPASYREKWRRLFSPAWMGGAAVAMAAVVFAVGISSQWRAHHTGADVPAETEQMRSRSVHVTSPHGDLGKLPLEITWEPVAGASEYAVTVSEVDRTVLIYKKVTSSRFVWPGSLYTLVKSGKTVLLNVSALNSTGNEIAGSGVITFHVLPKSRKPQ